MKFKAIVDRSMFVGALGVVEPGTEYNIENEEMIPIFKELTYIFEEVKDKPKIKKRGDK